MDSENAFIQAKLELWLRWPNTVFARAFADAIQHVHKDFKKKQHAVNRAIILFTQTRAHCVIFLYN